MQALFEQWIYCRLDDVTKAFLAKTSFVHLQSRIFVRYLRTSDGCSFQLKRTLPFLRRRRVLADADVLICVIYEYKNS